MNTKGFTLIEVLLALAVIAIALTALLKVTAQNIETTERIKEKNIAHWVGMQAVTMLQLNLIEINPNEESTQATKLLGEEWYWRVKVNQTSLQGIEQLIVFMSDKKVGPFNKTLIAYRLKPNVPQTQ